jgi:hypothetical protein
MRDICLFMLLFASGLVCNAQVKIIGHKGSSFIAPENKLASAKRLIPLGVKGITTSRLGWIRGQIEN